MLDSSNEKTLSFLGEVVETFNDMDKQILKIFFKSGNIDLSVDKSENLHLGDILIIEAKIKIKNIKPYENLSRYKLNIDR